MESNSAQSSNTDLLANRPLFIQIGPNKCGTSSLYHLFNQSGVKSVKYIGKKKSDGTPDLPRMFNLQAQIDRNIRLDQAPLTGLDGFDAFFDMEWSNDAKTFENYKHFKRFANAYPNAKFILNTRNRLDWLRSRTTHAAGRYLSKTIARQKMPGIEVIANWLKDFDQHHLDVNSYFADKTERLLVFDIDKDPIRKVIDFAAPEFELDAAHRSVHNKTPDNYKDGLMIRAFQKMFETPVFDEAIMAETKILPLSSAS